MEMIKTVVDITLNGAMAIFFIVLDILFILAAKKDRKNKDESNK